jgi:hypothetical protein
MELSRIFLPSRLAKPVAILEEDRPPAAITLTASPRDARATLREFEFEAPALASGEVLVIRGVRWLDDQITLDWERIIFTAGAPARCLVGVEDKDSGHWLVREQDVVQQLRGLKLDSITLGPTTLAVEFKPAPGGASKAYGFRWMARIERLSVVRRRHSDVPAISTPWQCLRLVKTANLAGNA